MSRTRYRFTDRIKDGAGNDWLCWESVLPLRGDSRYERVRCRADWFWHKQGGQGDG